MARWSIDGVGRRNGLQPRLVDLRIHGPSAKDVTGTFAFEFSDANGAVSWKGVSVHRSLSGAQRAADRFVGFSIPSHGWKKK